MASPILSWLPGGFIKGAGKAVTDVGKTFWGDRAAKDAQLSAEQLATLNEFAAEFIARQQRTRWDSFVDGLNRLICPGLALGASAAFVWAAWESASFVECMRALSIVPEPLWYVWGGIFAFYFAKRIIENAPKTWKVEPRALDLAKEIAAERTARRQAESAERQADAAERKATATERSAVGAERSAVAAERSAVGAERSATGAERSATGAERSATGAERSATGAERSADAVERGVDAEYPSKSAPQREPWGVSVA